MFVFIYKTQAKGTRNGLNKTSTRRRGALNAQSCSQPSGAGTRHPRGKRSSSGPPSGPSRGGTATPPAGLHTSQPRARSPTRGLLPGSPPHAHSPEPSPRRAQPGEPALAPFLEATFLAPPPPGVAARCLLLGVPTGRPSLTSPCRQGLAPRPRRPPRGAPSLESLRAPSAVPPPRRPPARASSPSSEEQRPGPLPSRPRARRYLDLVDAAEAVLPEELHQVGERAGPRHGGEAAGSLGLAPGPRRSPPSRSFVLGPRPRRQPGALGPGRPRGPGAQEPAPPGRRAHRGFQDSRQQSHCIRLGGLVVRSNFFVWGAVVLGGCSLLRFNVFEQRFFELIPPGHQFTQTIIKGSLP